MIGTGLKKLANENGMKVANGLAYGTFRGYSAAFWDGSGTKTMMLSTSIRDVDAKSEFFSRLGQVNYQKEYRVRELTTMDDGIVVVFNDTVGTLKKMDEFFNFFFPILDACGATKADVCSCCGQPFDGETIALIKEIAAGTLPGFVYGDAPVLVLALLANEPEYQSVVLNNLGMGVLFAAVGIYFILKKTHRSLKGLVIKELP